MSYCKYCGQKQKGYEKYCEKCGNEINEQYTLIKRGRLEKFACELAYFGFIFWLPLVIGKKDEESKRIANQGLWGLVTSFAAFKFIQCFKAANMYFEGTIFFAITNPIYGLIFVLFLGFMVILLHGAIRNVRAIHSDRQVDNIIFFDEIRIIR